MSISQLSISYLQVVSAATQERGISLYNEDCLGESAGRRDGTIYIMFPTHHCWYHLPGQRGKIGKLGTHILRMQKAEKYFTVHLHVLEQILL